MKRRVLLVDDEAEVLDLLRQLMDRIGYESLLAGDAEQALEILRTEKVDVMVTDIVMPGMDGWTLAMRVREAYPDVRIAGISGKVLPRPGESPFDVFVDKPFSFQALINGIQGLAEDETPRIVWRKSRQMRICLTGEESIVAQTFQSFLSDLGHEVVLVQSLHELLDHLASQPADLVITDLRTPGDNALMGEVHRKYPDVAIVIMTDGHPSLSAEEAIASGVYAYLHKPVSLAELEFLVVRSSERRIDG